MTDRNGWFADVSDRDDEGHDPTAPWMAYLQMDGMCSPLGDTRFPTKSGCEQFIRDNIIGKEMLPDD